MTLPRGQAWFALALTAAASGPAQGQAQVPRLVFDGATFDVTGAGRLDLGDLDAVLRPFQRAFRDGRESLALEATVDSVGTVVACRTQGSNRLQQAGSALCAHALASGHFDRFSFITIAYTQATYSTVIRKVGGGARPGQPQFIAEAGFPLEGRAVAFLPTAMPDPSERLAPGEVVFRPAMVYPSVALRSGIEGRVEAELTFDEAGQVASCRPIQSSNTARLAYETCIQTRLSARLRNPPDGRSYTFAANWLLGD